MEIWISSANADPEPKCVAYNWIYIEINLPRTTGLPKKIHADRGRQFAAYTWIAFEICCVQLDFYRK